MKAVAMPGCTLVWSCPKCDFKHTVVVTETVTFDMEQDYPAEMMIHVMTEGHYADQRYA